MDFWDLLKGLVSGGFYPTTARDLFLDYVFTTLLDPPTPSLEVQKYFDWMSAFLWICLGLLVFELCVRLYLAATSPKHDFGDEMKQMAFSLGFYCIALPSVPTFLVGMRLFANVLGKYFMAAFAGNNKDVFLASLKVVTGVGPIDFVITVIQIVFLVMLLISLFAIPVLFVISSILFMVGVSTRWMGDFGDKLFRLSILVTVYGVAGNALLMVIMAIGVGIGNVFFPNDATTRTWINTIAIIVAGSVTFWILRSVRDKIKVLADMAQSGYNQARDKVRGDSPSYERDGARKHSESATKTHEAHGENNAQSLKVKREAEAQQKEQAAAEGTTTAKRRHSTTASRSVAPRSEENPPATSKKAAAEPANQSNGTPRNRSDSPTSEPTASRQPARTSNGGSSQPSPVHDNQPSHGEFNQTKVAEHRERSQV